MCYETRRYENKFGSLVLQAVEGYKPITDIQHYKEHLFGVETAERVSVITENRSIQLAFIQPYSMMDSCFVITHRTANLAAVAKIVSIDYRSKTPAKTVIELQHGAGAYVDII